MSPLPGIRRHRIGGPRRRPRAELPRRPPHGRRLDRGRARRRRRSLVRCISSPAWGTVSATRQVAASASWPASAAGWLQVSCHRSSSPWKPRRLGWSGCAGRPRRPRGGRSWPIAAGPRTWRCSTSRLPCSMRCPSKNGVAKLVVPVRATTPARAAGPGMGQDSLDRRRRDRRSELTVGDADLRFGDLVAVTDMDGRVSRFPRPGWVSVGVVSHGPSPIPGHGIGLTLLLSGPTRASRCGAQPTATLAAALSECHQHRAL